MKTLKKFVLTLLLTFSMTAEASLVGTFVKLLTDASRETDRLALIGKFAADGDAERYSDNLSRAIFGLSGGKNRSPNAEEVLGFIRGSNLPDADKEKVIAVLSKQQSEITAEDLDFVTRELQRAAHSIDPVGVILRTCESGCVVNGSRLADDIFIVDDPAMKRTLSRYPTEGAQRGQIQRLLRQQGMGRMNASDSFITSNGADSSYMLLFLNALKGEPGYPESTKDFAKALKEFSKKPDGSYDLFDSANPQRLYRLIVELDPADHANYARNFSEIATACVSQYPKKDCFFTKMKDIAKRDNPDMSEADVDKLVKGMKENGCFFD